MERQHIALTEAQIIAAEKGELQLETRDGKKTVQFVWFRDPYDQGRGDVLCALLECGNKITLHKHGKEMSMMSNNDLFVSEPDVNFSESTELPNDFMKVGEHKTFEGDEYVVCVDEKPDDCYGCDLGEVACRRQKNIKCCNTILKRVVPSEPKPLYEVGEIIEMSRNGEIWFDVEYFVSSKGFVFGWLIFEDENKNGIYHYCNKYHRKKQKQRIYISGRVKNLAYKEAFDLFETAENELIAKGYDVCNPMKEVPFNETWSWFDYLSADIKLMEKCTHIYMLSNWRESGGASVEHEAAKWNNFTILYQ